MIRLYLCTGALIFGCGAFGFVIRRNLILMFLSLELMLFGVSLNLIAFGDQHDDLGGQTFAILILAVAACEAALALALVVTLYRSRGSLDVDVWRSLRERVGERSETNADAMQMLDGGEHLLDPSGQDLPKLTPAGRDPLAYPVQEEFPHREHAGIA